MLIIMAKEKSPDERAHKICSHFEEKHITVGTVIDRPHVVFPMNLYAKQMLYTVGYGACDVSVAQILFLSYLRILL